jgi:hypothetical protein
VQSSSQAKGRSALSHRRIFVEPGDGRSEAVATAILGDLRPAFRRPVDNEEPTGCLLAELAEKQSIIQQSVRPALLAVLVSHFYCASSVIRPAG